MPPVPEDVDSGLATIAIASVLNCSALDVDRDDFPLIWRRNALLRLQIDALREEQRAARAKDRRRHRGGAR